MATIIAEIGQNHLGLMDLATDLIRLAKDNGADLAKFQLYSHEALYKDHPEIPNVELSFEQARGLFEYGKKIGIEVFFSVFDVERVKWCEEIGVNRYKIAFSQWNNFLLWREVEQTRKPISGSTNFKPCYPLMCSKLFCVPKYPATLGDYVFNFDWFDGISDHTIGLDCAKIALARGAQIIEKHFAVDHDTGIDAKWSMTPGELRELKRWEMVCKQVL